MTLLPALNIAAELTEMARRQPHADAIIANLRRDSSGKLTGSRSTFQQLETHSNNIASGLLSTGISKTTRVALCLRPGFDFFAVTFALFKIGAIPVLIDPGIGLRNFGGCISQAEPSAFIGLPLVHLLRRALRWAQKTNRINITTGWFGGIPLATIARPGAARSSRTEIHGELDSTIPSDAAAILFTSGSTGPAKGVLYTHANFSAQVDILRNTYAIRPGEIDLATFPLFGLFGPALGMTTIIPTMDFTRPGFVNPRNITDPITQFKITNMFGSPALIDSVGRYGVEHRITLPSLKRVISAGAPVPATALARFKSMLSPDAQIFTPYGATEALPVTSIGSDEILTDTAALTDIGKGVCVGRPVSTVNARIINITDAPIPNWSDILQCPALEIGEITVRGPAVTGEYFKRPEATRASKIEDPASSTFYHRMGDVGYFDESGRLWFCGRKSQRVRAPGGDLFSTQFEGIFNTHPHVAKSALVGIRRGDAEEPVICIERNTEGKRTAEKTLRTELLALAQRHERTRIIHHILFHPRFPVDIRHNAKIGREKLALWAQRKLK